MTVPVSRQYARLLARLERGLCLRCPSRSELNPRTRRWYHLCPSCRAKKNAQRNVGPRVEAA